MAYIKYLEELESSEERINEKQDMHFDNIDNKTKSIEMPKSFEEELNDIFVSLENLAALQTFGENIDEASSIIIGKLKRLLEENNKSEEEKQEIMNSAYNIIRTEDINNNMRIK